MNKVVHFEKKEGIATVTIDNPPMNVLSDRVLNGLSKVFSTIADDQEIIVVILTGAGDRAFMAGGDIKEFSQNLGRVDGKETSMKSHKVMNEIVELEKPTIAVLNGITYGGGCELALTCDIRIAEAHVQLGFPEVKLGLLPGAGGTVRLPRLIGSAKAKELMFTGDSLSAEEAKEIGLVNQVVPSGEGIAVAQELARKIGGYSLKALSRIKRSIDEGLDLDLEAAVQQESEKFGELYQSADAKEGLQAFIEKRKPQFSHQ